MCCIYNVFKALPSPGSEDPADLAVLAGLRVVDNEDDDPVLLWPDGTIVDTWREDYPYDERMTREYYDHHKRLLQIELVKLQNWVKDTGQRIVIVFEGRRGRQGRHDQAVHRAPQPPRRPRGRAGEAIRAGVHPVVLPAVRDAPAVGRRDRD